MAVYKVPQDVEAEDKLIGPFSFRQFIYLIVAALGIFMSWVLSRVFIGLFVIPLPIVFAFLALALPLRKDQPMETYLIAMIKFFFKPRRRIWEPEGTVTLVNITAQKAVEGPQLKEFGGSEASERLAYLAQVVDTQGWSTRGAMSANDNLSDIVLAEATHAEDVLDSSSGVAQAFDQRIAQADDARLQAARQQMQAAITQPQQTPAPQTQTVQEPVDYYAEPAQSTPPQDQQTIPPPTQQTPIYPAAVQATEPTAELEVPANLNFNPYPTKMRQHVIAPATPQQNLDQPYVQEVPVSPPTVMTQTPPQTQAQAENTPSSDPMSPDIMRLANNNDLSISAIAREAHRLKSSDEEEVVISLR